MASGHRPEDTSRHRPRRRRTYLPAPQELEERALMAIDLADIAGPPPDGPFGIQEIGNNSGGGAGWSVAEVGDVNQDGFDDFLIGAPTVDFTDIPVLGPGTTSAAYLVFGSRRQDGQNIDWRNLTPDQRIGDLGSLGNASQTNPVTGTPGFLYSGITFVTRSDQNSQIGAAVAGVGDVNGDGIPDFMIGAPGHNDANNTLDGAGRAYLIFGSRNLSATQPRTIDLDNIADGSTDPIVVTFTNNRANARSGYAMAGVADFIADGSPDIAIGAPNITVSGQAQQGAVYVVSGNFLQTITSSRQVALNEVGQTNGVGGFVFAGEASGDGAGSAIAGVGNTAGRTTSAGTPIFDMLIGAPDRTPTGVINGEGSAFLVYGQAPNVLNGFVQTSNGFQFIPLSGVGNNIPGAEFIGENLGDATGYAVSTAGDFNADGLADFMIGSPFWNGPSGIASGRAHLIFGRAATPSPPGAINGTFNLSALPASIPHVRFAGPSPAAFAGWSLTAVGLINDDSINEIAIGAPGVNGGSGTVYLIPGNPDLLGNHNLANAETAPQQGLAITLSQPTTANFLGSSVSSALFINANGQTVDADTKADLIVGAMGFSLPGREQAGTGYALEGAFLPLPNVVSTAITTTIGVDRAFPDLPNGFFSVNPTTPDAMDIYVFSTTTTTPPFNPVRDLDSKTVVVNGVAFPNATIAQDPVDENGDGIPDAIVTISPRSALNLTTNTRTLTFNARTLSTSPLPNRRVVGTASISVSGGGGTPGGLPSNRNTLLGLNNRNAAVPDFGARLIPSLNALPKLRWQPLGLRNAYRQFLPRYNFAQRFRNFYQTPKVVRNFGSRKEWTGYRTTTLGKKVFTRGRFGVGFYDARFHRR